jgi:hypothetical protein
MVQFPHDSFWGAATSAYQVEGNNVNSGWDIYLEGLYSLILKLKKFGLPYLENGICADDDNERRDFIHSRPQNRSFQAADGAWPLSISFQPPRQRRGGAFIHEHLNPLSSSC